MGYLEPYNLEELSGNIVNWHNLYNYTLSQIRTAIPACVAITAGQTLGKGDAFIVGPDNYARRAKADGSTLWPADGITESTTIGSGGAGYGRIYGKATLTTTLNTVGYHYLHPSSPGFLTSTKPADYAQPLVKALDLINVLIRPFSPLNILEVDTTSVTTPKDKAVSNVLAKGWEDHKGLTYTGTPHGIVEIDVTDTGTNKNRIVSNRMAYVRDRAMFGDMALTVVPNSWSSYAATLNAAAVGTYVQTLTVALKTAGGYEHDWFVNTLGLVATENVSDSDVAAPTLSNTGPVLVAGQYVLTATYDTDAGSTKTYAAGDYVTVTINTVTLMGYVLPAVTFIDSIQ